MIVVECYSDELLIKSLGFSRKMINHEGGKGKVFHRLKKQNNGIGIIDEDPNSIQPPEFMKYELLESLTSVKLFKYQSNNRLFIIQISNNLEDWLVKRATVNNIDLKKYSLPSDPKRLHGIARIDKKRNFLKFVQDLVEQDEECICIRKWITDNI